MSKTISSIVETKVKQDSKKSTTIGSIAGRKVKQQQSRKSTTGSTAEEKSNNPFLHHNQLSVPTLTQYSFHAHVTKAACERS